MRIPDFIDKNKMQIEELANERVLFLIKTLKQYDSNGNVEMNDLGFPKLVKFNKVLGILIRELNNNSGPKSIKAKLEALRDNGQHEIGELLIKLGDSSIISFFNESNLLLGIFLQLYLSIENLLLHVTIKVFNNSFSSIITYYNIIFSLSFFFLYFALVLMDL